MAWFDFIYSLFDHITGNNKPKLKLFADEQRRWAATSQYERGLRVIDVDKIVGTVDRSRALEMDANFQYKNGTHPYRLRRVIDAVKQGTILPPIDVDQIKDEYFVIDGHHRVAAAKEIGQIYIDANVREYLPDAKNPANRLFYERRHWKKETGLRDIRLTEVGGYNKLLNRISDYQHRLAEEGPQLSFREAAGDWYTQEYLPVAEIIESQNILAKFPGRTLADIFIYIMDHRWLESKRLGRDIGLQQSLDDFIADFGHESLARRMVEPIVRLGVHTMAQAHSALHPNPLLRWMPEDWEDEFIAGFIVGLLALPWAVLKKLKQRLLVHHTSSANHTKAGKSKAGTSLSR